jgi:hypothetical protein
MAHGVALQNDDPPLSFAHRSRRRCGEPRPAADVGGGEPAPARSRRRCGEPRPGADVGGGEPRPGPVPAQMW